MALDLTPFQGKTGTAVNSQINSNLQDLDSRKANASAVSNVDNTSDENKPISDLTQAALDFVPMRTKAEFESLREKNLNDYRTGSGFLHWGKHFHNGSRYIAVNQGIWSDTGVSNVLYMGVSSTISQDSTSKTNDPIVLVGGIEHTLSNINSTSALNILNFPPAPNGTKTLNTTGNVITTHASTTAAFAAENATTNVITSAADLVVLRTTELELTGNQAYPLGNMMSGISTRNGVATDYNGTNNLLNRFGPWDTATSGNGWVWDDLSDNDRNAIIEDDANNIFNENGVAKQNAYHIKTHEGFRDYRPDEYKQALIDHGYTESTDERNKGLWTITDGGREFLCIPICLQGGFNQGAYSGEYNTPGCGLKTSGKWLVNYRPTSRADCFIGNSGGTLASGVTGRSDQYEHYDVKFSGRCIDLRFNANKQDFNTLLQNKIRSDIAGITRGGDGLLFTKVFNSTAAVTSEYTIVNQDDTSNVVAQKELLAQYDSLPSVDIIGSPANIKATFPDGVIGEWLSTIPDGASNEFFLNDKSNQGTSLSIVTATGSSSWSANTRAVNTTRNSITVSYDANNVILHHYESSSNFTQPSVNPDIYGPVGNVVTTTHSLVDLGNRLHQSLSGNIGRSNLPNSIRELDAVDYLIYQNKLSNDNSYLPTHEPLRLGAPGNNSTGVKTLVSLTQSDGLIYSMYHFAELKYDGNDWGDDNTIPIVDNMSTKTNDNSQTVIIGCHIGQFPIGVA